MITFIDNPSSDNYIYPRILNNKGDVFSVIVKLEHKRYSTISEMKLNRIFWIPVVECPSNVHYLGYESRYNDNLELMFSIDKSADAIDDNDLVKTINVIKITNENTLTLGLRQYSTFPEIDSNFSFCDNPGYNYLKVINNSVYEQAYLSELIFSTQDTHRIETVDGVKCKVFNYYIMSCDDKFNFINFSHEQVTDYFSYVKKYEILNTWLGYVKNIKVYVEVDKYNARPVARDVFKIKFTQRNSRELLLCLKFYAGNTIDSITINNQVNKINLNKYIVSRHTSKGNLGEDHSLGSIVPYIIDYSPEWVVGAEKLCLPRYGVQNDLVDLNTVRAPLVLYINNQDVFDKDVTFIALRQINNLGDWSSSYIFFKLTKLGTNEVLKFTDNMSEIGTLTLDNTVLNITVPYKGGSHFDIEFESYYISDEIKHPSRITSPLKTDDEGVLGSVTNLGYSNSTYLQKYRININYNDGSQRECDIVFKSSNGGTITLHITQEANPLSILFKEGSNIIESIDLELNKDRTIDIVSKNGTSDQPYEITSPEDLNNIEVEFSYSTGFTTDTETDEETGVTTKIWTLTDDSGTIKPLTITKSGNKLTIKQTSTKQGLDDGINIDVVQTGVDNPKSASLRINLYRPEEEFYIKYGSNEYKETEDDSDESDDLVETDIDYTIFKLPLISANTTPINIDVISKTNDSPGNNLEWMIANKLSDDSEDTLDLFGSQVKFGKFYEYNSSNQSNLPGYSFLVGKMTPDYGSLGSSNKITLNIGANTSTVGVTDDRTGRLGLYQMSTGSYFEFEFTQIGTKRKCYVDISQDDLSSIKTLSIGANKVITCDCYYLSGDVNSRSYFNSGVTVTSNSIYSISDITYDDITGKLKFTITRNSIGVGKLTIRGTIMETLGGSTPLDTIVNI